MGGESWGMVSPTVAVAAVNVEREEHWKHFDNSVNFVSFGFVATAILISMFLVMAIFERFLRPRSSPSGSRTHGDPEAPMMFDGKLRYPSPKVCSSLSLSPHALSFSGCLRKLQMKCRYWFSCSLSLTYHLGIRTLSKSLQELILMAVYNRK